MVERMSKFDERKSSFYTKFILKLIVFEASLNFMFSHWALPFSTLIFHFSTSLVFGRQMAVMLPIFLMC